MRDVQIVFEGVNAYLPHENDQSLLVVMPNATRLGRSNSRPPTGQRTSSHVPTVWLDWYHEEQEDISQLRDFFPGCDLIFEFYRIDDEGNEVMIDGGLDMGEVQQIGASSPFQLDPGVLQKQPTRELAAHCLISTGKLTAVKDPRCAVSWDRSSSISTDIITNRLNVDIENVSKLEVFRRTFGGAGKKSLIFLGSEDLEKYKGTIQIHAGNACAEDILRWQSESKRGRSDDRDFAWLYQLTPIERNRLGELAHKGLGKTSRYLVPNVKSDGPDTNATVDAVYRSLRGGGSGVGCECNGVIATTRSF